MTPLTRHQIAWRAAQDLEEGTYVNLGLGVPTLIANYKPTDRDFMFHSENGIVGVGPLATEEEADPDFVDAGSQKITLLPGSSISDSAMAFAMIRGGHVDVTLLGGFEVSETGDLANWDAKMTHKGQLVGGAMDLVAGAKSVRVKMQLSADRRGRGRLRVYGSCRGRYHRCRIRRARGAGRSVAGRAAGQDGRQAELRR
jgi:3-oxoadipate CoA-transferase beta subunit